MGWIFGVRFMQILAVDIGNTRVSSGLYDGECLVWRRDFQSGDRVEFPDSGVDVCAVSRVSSQFPELEVHLQAQCPVYVLTRPPSSLVVHYDSPMGADRIANALAAQRYAPHGAIVIDLGTATHFDILIDGALYGGPILPGLMTLHQALGMRIPHLPQTALGPVGSPVAATTAEAMNAGSVLCTVGAVERIVADIRRAFPSVEFATLVTGGNAPLILPHIQYDFSVPNLTLEGIRQFARLSLLAALRKDIA